MEVLTISLTVLFFILPLFLYTLFYHGKPSPKLPPGPTPLPLIGNFHLLGHLPHRSMAKLAQQYGPIMSLRLGKLQAIVVSSPQYAELILKHHDASFSGRPDTQVWVAGQKAMAFTPCGDYWRRVRLMSTQHLLSTTKIAEFEGLRTREIAATMKRLAEAAVVHEVVNLDAVVGELLENIVYTMVLGKEKEGEIVVIDLKEVIQDSIHLVGEFNLGDVLPILRPLDLQGIERRFKAIKERADKILDRIIEDHLNEKDIGKEKDILSTLLNLMNTKSDKFFSSFDTDNVKAIIYELFAGGIETSLRTILWTLSALLKNPRTLTTLQQELDKIIGKDRMVMESDLPNLSYLDMVVKEVFRLYPVLPLLIPHESINDVNIDGYMIPKKTRIFINVWAIGHEPKTWSENVEEFYPERFIRSDIDVRGGHFGLLPFGAGRRRCPGWLLGWTSVKLILAQLVHCFEWELPHNMQVEDLDMNEKFGMVISRVDSLFGVPSTRLQVPLM